MKTDYFYPKEMPRVARQRQTADTKRQDFMGYNVLRRHETYRIIQRAWLIHQHHVLDISASRHNRYHHVHDVEKYWYHRTSDLRMKPTMFEKELFMFLEN